MSPKDYPIARTRSEARHISMNIHQRAPELPQDVVKVPGGWDVALLDRAGNITSYV